jgi:YARHG domain
MSTFPRTTNFFIFLVSLILIMLKVTFANDGAYFASGNQIIPLQETEISVKKEVLTLKRIKDDKVRITVDYIFHNPNKEKTILMGFEAGSPFGGVDGTPRKGEHPYIENFQVNCNGKSISHKVSIFSLSDLPKKETCPLYTLENLKHQKALPKIDSPEDTNFFYVYHFPATFPTGDTKVTHTYDYEMSLSVYTNTEINYLLTPALRWANKQIDDFTLIIDLGEFQQYHIDPDFFDDLKSWTSQGRVKIIMENVKNEISGDTKNRITVHQHQGSIIFHAKNFAPKGELSIFANRQLYHDETSDSPNPKLDVAVMKLSLAKLPYLEGKSLKNKFSRKVLENLPYARRGYIFQNAELKAFYEKQPWYLPDPNYKDVAITEEEQKWLKELRAIKIAV